MPPEPNKTPEGPPMLAVYANYFEVGQNAFEFLVDFGQFAPDANAVRMHTRIATGPGFAKLLLAMLADAVRSHESEHGEIATSQAELDLPELLLRTLPDVGARLRGADAACERDAAGAPAGATSRPGHKR